MEERTLENMEVVKIKMPEMKSFDNKKTGKEGHIYTRGILFKIPIGEVEWHNIAEFEEEKTNEIVGKLRVGDIVTLKEERSGVFWNIKKIEYEKQPEVKEEFVDSVPPKQNEIVHYSSETKADERQKAIAIGQAKNQAIEALLKNTDENTKYDFSSEEFWKSYQDLTIRFYINNKEVDKYLFENEKGL